MKATYFEGDGVVKIRFSDKLTEREASQDWHTHINYAEDNSTRLLRSFCLMQTK